MLNERARERKKVRSIGERRNLIERERERKKMPRSSTLPSYSACYFNNNIKKLGHRDV